MVAGESVKWKHHFNQLIARAIPESEFPKIAKNMVDDGLIAILTTDGIKWYAGRYQVRPKVVRDMWNLSKHQMSRFNRWVYMNDPFMVLMETTDMIDCMACGLLIEEGEMRYLHDEPHCHECYLADKHDEVV